MDLDLTQPSQLVPLLQKYGLYTQKSLGQHFLVDRRILDAIIQSADIQPTDTVIEVGTGTGVLTRQLATKAAWVITFEVDSHLNHLLAETLLNYPNIELHFEDFLKVNVARTFEALADISTDSRYPEVRRLADDTMPAVPVANLEAVTEFIPAKSAAQHHHKPYILSPNYKFVANLPYNVGSHILDILVKSSIPPRSITILLQKEVAQKITAQPPHATYLSNFIALYGVATYVKTVRPGSFFPAPAVDSAIVHIDRRLPAANGEPNASAFSHFLHRGFAQPRKMLNKSFSNQELESAHIDPRQRPENLTFTDWLTLFRIIQS